MLQNRLRIYLHIDKINKKHFVEEFVPFEEILADWWINKDTSNVETILEWKVFISEI